MTSINLTSAALKEIATGLGADFTAIADPSCFDNPDYQGKNPKEIMDDLRSVIILGVSVPKGTFSTLPKGRAEYTNTLMAGTATLRVIAFRLAKVIEKSGYLATIAPSEGSEFGYWYADRSVYMADFSFKYAAYYAGIGNFGMNHLLLTKEYGPKVRMTAILTDAPLEPDRNEDLPFVNEACKDCMKCIEICPAKAILADGTIHRDRCAEYMFNVLGGLRCGMCIKVCPLDKF